MDLPRGQYEIPLLIYDRLLRKHSQLTYPVLGIPDAPWVPEVFGNAMLVNGKLLPYLSVEPRTYRLRVANGSNARFYRLSLEGDVEFRMIGSDQGMLEAPVRLQRLLLAPAERADLIVDFSKHAGQRMVLESDSLRLMQFRVAPRSVSASGPLPLHLRSSPRLSEKHAVRVRRLTLDEHLNLADQSTGML